MSATTPLDGLRAGLRLAIGAGETDADVAALSRVDDWNTAVALAQRHRVVSLFIKGLRTEPALLADTDIGLQLDALGRRVIRRGMGQLQGLKLATDALVGGDVPYLVLKGLPLSQQIYDHPFIRESNDIDLLVPPWAFDDAERLLCERGWTRIMPVFRETPARMHWYRKFVKDYILSGPGGILELHHRLSENPRYFDVPFERLCVSSAVTTIGGLDFPTLEEDHRFVYLVAHGGKTLWHRLKWLCDIAVLLADMTPEQFQREVVRCREARLESVLAAALWLCREELHVRPPTEAAPPLFGWRASFLAGRARGVWTSLDLPPVDKAAILALKPDADFVLREVALLACHAVYSLLRLSRWWTRKRRRTRNRPEPR